MWIRNDLRLHDNEAFSQAIDNDSVLLVYIYDRTLIKRDTVSSFHLKFIEESLDDLSDELKKKFGATLNIYHSDTLDVFRDLLSRYQVKNVFSNRIFKEKLSFKLLIHFDKKLSFKIFLAPRSCGSSTTLNTS